MIEVRQFFKMLLLFVFMTTTAVASDQLVGMHPFQKICDSAARSNFYDIIFRGLASRNGVTKNCDSVVKAIKKGKRLDLSSFRGLGDLSLFEDFTEVTILNLSWSGISSLEGIEVLFPNLKRLLINHPETDFGPLQKLKKLKSLHIQELPAGTDFSSIYSLTTLTHLSILNSNIEHIPYLLSRNLKSLILPGNRLRDLQFLRAFESLDELNIWGSGFYAEEVPIPVRDLRCARKPSGNGVAEARTIPSYSSL